MIYARSERHWDWAMYPPPENFKVAFKIRATLGLGDVIVWRGKPTHSNVCNRRKR